jgi:hypothetical protein
MVTTALTYLLYASAMTVPVHALRSLEDVLAWAFAQRPPAELLEVIVQDEFTHDVIVQHCAEYLVFDTT